MNHSFNVAVATEYGMLEAVLLENINYWIAKNKANDVHFHDGYYWTYNSTKALAGLFPYASKTTIYRALRHLEDEGLVLSGNYNKAAYDRTAWYAVTEKGSLLLEGKDDVQNEKNTGDGNVHNEEHVTMSENTTFQNEKSTFQNEKSMFQNEKSMFQNGNFHFSKYKNGFVQNEPTIPDINTNINTDSNLTVSKDTVCRTDVQRVKEQWNLLATYGIKPVSSINPKTKRYEMLIARIRSYGIEKVIEAIGNIKKSDFLCGSNRKGWVITFEWFVRPNNFIKVLEDNYATREPDVPAARDTGQQTGSGYSRELLARLEGGSAGGSDG